MRLALAGVAAAALVGCGGGDDPLRVFAASSLRDVLPALDADAEYAFGGSDLLVTQVLEGVQADVVATAGPAPMARLRDERLVDVPVVFASNRLVVVVPASGSSRVRSLDDLTREGLRLVLADKGVPAGDYAREALAAAGLQRALERVVSLEDDVRGVLAKVALGEADAGIVYATDVAAAGEDVREVAIPARVQPEIEYVAAVVTESGRAPEARAFVDALTSPSGRTALTEAGFSLP